ncbi:MAG TPA: YdeI/OmpD-associated family protein [Gemmatimonadales bacterium]|nr:YdeI/OmpD-associated family protein [Gemmatimonadales bacterium]
MKTFRAASVEHWRNWLAAHHDAEAEVWLIFYKRPSEVASLAHKDALDEALCFGWVDSLVKRLDNRRYAIKFTPRRAASRWSDLNRTRYAVLKASGRLQPAGLARAPTDRGSAPRPPRLELPPKLPAYIQTALRKHPAASRGFKALSPEQRRRYFAWIESAKQQETKLRRLQEALRLLTAGKVLGLK